MCVEGRKPPHRTNILAKISATNHYHHQHRYTKEAKSLRSSAHRGAGPTYACGSHLLLCKWSRTPMNEMMMMMRRRMCTSRPFLLRTELRRMMLRIHCTGAHKLYRDTCSFVHAQPCASLASSERVLHTSGFTSPHICQACLQKAVHKGTSPASLLAGRAVDKWNHPVRCKCRETPNFTTLPLGATSR